MLGERWAYSFPRGVVTLKSSSGLVHESPRETSLLSWPPGVDEQHKWVNVASIPLWLLLPHPLGISRIHKM